MTEPHRSITNVVIDRISRARSFYEEVDVTCGGIRRDGNGLDGEFGVRLRVSFVDEQQEQVYGNGGEKASEKG